MSHRNTTSSQDSEIDAAESSHHIANLVEIINELDLKIEEWKDAAETWGCDSPRSLRERISQLPEIY